MEYVVNACDAGREGELIFKHVYDLLGSTLPVKQLWISSMEDSVIREGFADLKDGSVYGNICEASVCRAQADWLVGMNATRGYTTKYFKKLAVGRGTDAHFSHACGVIYNIIPCRSWGSDISILGRWLSGKQSQA